MTLRISQEKVLRLVEMAYGGDPEAFLVLLTSLDYLVFRITENKDEVIANRYGRVLFRCLDDLEILK